MSGFGIHGKRIDSSTSRLNAAQSMAAVEEGDYTEGNRGSCP